MIKINININELNTLHTNLTSIHNKITAINNQIFITLKKLDTMWDDPNTSVFLTQNNLDKVKIDEYNEETQKVNNSILEFINDLTKIAVKCNCSSNSNFDYNSENMKFLIENTQKTYNFTKIAKSQLDSLNVPSSFRYSLGLTNMKYKFIDINENLKKTINDLEEIMNLTNVAYNKIKETPQTERLVLKPLNYISNINEVNLVNSKDKVANAINSQNLMANKKEVEYINKDSTFTNNEQFKNYSKKEVETTKADNNFVNQANHISASNNAIIQNEIKDDYQKTTTSQTYTKKENNYEHQNLAFVNNENIKSVNENTNNNFNQQFTFNKNEKSDQATDSQINFTKSSNNINIPKAQEVSNNNINYQTTNNFQINEKSLEVSDSHIEIE